MLVVTGAAGFIGSNLINALNRTSDTPIVAVDIVAGSLKAANVADFEHTTWVDPNRIFQHLERCSDQVDAVIHLGAETSTTATDRAAVFETNVSLSQEFWRWCAEHGVPFIYASSASVYGDGMQGFKSSFSPESLNALQPLNIYGESKLAFDLFVAEEVRTGASSPPQWAGLRFFNVYGSRERHKGTQASVVTQMYPTAAAGDPYALFRSHKDGIADGEQKRDFVFVDDCCDVMTWLLANPDVSGLFNVGTGQARTFLDLAKAVYSAAEQPVTVTWRDTPAHLQAHYQYFTEADITPLRQAGYKSAFTSLEEGVTITVNRYRAQTGAPSTG